VIDQRGLYTLAEASELTGLSTEALRLRIKRGKLVAERGNDGQPRVRITDAEREDFARLLARRQSTLIRQYAGDANTIKMLEAAAAALHERAARAEAEATALRERAERAEGQAEAERTRGERAEAEAAAERTRAAQAEREREAAKVTAAEAVGEVRGLREALAEARRPFWRRWIG
jgi:chromosome segregation ATPase